MKKYLKNSVLPFALALGGLVFTACTDDIEGGKPVDEGAYDAVTRVDGMLLDRNSNKNESVIELRSNEYTTDVYFALSQVPQKGVDVVIEVDPDYVQTYNKEHETEFLPFPAEQVSIERDGVLLLAPDELNSVDVSVTLSGRDKLEENKTYVLALRAVSKTEGITLSDEISRAVYLVKSLDADAVADTDKGPDAIKTVLYFEVNDVNPLNALEFKLESGKLFWDYIILFAANINWNAETGRVYVYNNPNVQFLLDNNEEFLQPLRKRGMKVILGILGNHDDAGVAQLSDMGCREFAKELAAMCEAYNLDGVNFDDEYSNNYPDPNNPWFTSPSSLAAARLSYETKKAMPDKIVSIFDYGYMGSNTIVDGATPGDYLDFSVANYGGYSRPYTGMTLKQCSGMSIELNLNIGDDSEATARRQKQAGYGHYMFFALNPSKYFDSYYKNVARCQSACRGLYEQELLAPTHWYKKNDATRYPL